MSKKNSQSRPAGKGLNRHQDKPLPSHPDRTRQDKHTNLNWNQDKPKPTSKKVTGTTGTRSKEE